MEDERPVADYFGRRIELHRERPLHPICAFVSEQDPAAGNLWTDRCAELLALQSSDLKHILEGRIEPDLDRKRSGDGSVVR